jgi:hypothetical protein
MKIKKSDAEAVLLEEAEAAKGAVDAKWEKKIREFSELCEKAPKTHIAMLGTALLAKSVNTRADAFSIKERAGKGSLPGSYSARGVVAVWADKARELGVNLGVTGREPLNNSPYFGINRLTRELPAKAGAHAAALAKLCDILDEIQDVEKEADVRKILRAFIRVRRDYNPAFVLVGKTGAVNAGSLAQIIREFVAKNGEGGKRAQAAAAGLLDVFVGDEARIMTSRVNDPDKGFPGDVAIREDDKIDKVFEVRDKVVTCSDLDHFVDKVAPRKIRNAAMFAVASGQGALDCTKAVERARSMGVLLHVAYGWDEAVRQLLFWGRLPPADAAQDAALRIYIRAKALEVSSKGVEEWTKALAEAT